MTHDRCRGEGAVDGTREVHATKQEQLVTEAPIEREAASQFDRLVVQPGIPVSAGRQFKEA